MTKGAATSTPERQMLIRKIVVEHPRYVQALDGLGEFHHPVKGGLHSVGTLGMLIGDSRAGKTFVAKRYVNGFPESLGDGGMVMPVVYADMPTEHCGGMRGVLVNIAEAIGLTHTLRMTNQIMVDGILRSLRDRKVELLILDEFEQLFRENDRRLAGLGRGLIRKILNLQTLSVLCVGLTSTYALLRDDEQLLGRGGLPYREIRPYDWDDQEEQLTFQKICDAFDSKLPFEESSNLGAKRMAAALYWVTKGNIGHLKWLIEAAAAHALNADALRIERSHFARAFDDRMELNTDYNPFRDDISLAPKKVAKSGNVKTGGTRQVFSKSAQKDVRDAA